jgi:hypothetical protein
MLNDYQNGFNDALDCVIGLVKTLKKERENDVSNYYMCAFIIASIKDIYGSHQK